MIIIHLNPEKDDSYSFIKYDSNKEIRVTDVTIKRMNDRRETKLFLFFSLSTKGFNIVDQLIIDESCSEFLNNIKKAYKNSEESKKVIFCYKKTIYMAEGKLEKVGEDKYRITNISIYKDEVVNRKTAESNDAYGNIDIIEYDNKIDKTNKSKELFDIFEYIEEEKDEEHIDFNKYVNSMVYIYYNYLVDFNENFNKGYKPNKLSGIISYLAFKEYIKNNKTINKVCISHPNNYIKDFKQEFDLLLLDSNSDEYIHDNDHVKAVIELKTSGIVEKTSFFKSKFIQNIIIPYLCNCIIDEERIKEKIENEIEYNEKKFSDDDIVKKLFEFINECIDKNNSNIMPSFIYFASHERIGSKGYNYYKSTCEVINKYNELFEKKGFPKFYIWFATTKITEDKFTIPLKEHVNLFDDLNKIYK